MTKIRLTQRAFLLLSAWQLVGVVSTLHAPLIGVYLACLPIVAAILWLDRRTVAKSEDLRVTVTAPAKVELDQAFKPVWHIAFARQVSLNRDGLNWTAPDHPCLSFPVANVQISMGDLQQDRRGFSKEVACVAIKLGQVSEVKHSMDCKSRLGFWNANLSLSAVFSTRVAPYSAPMSRQEFERTIERQRMLYAGSRQLVRGQNNDQFYSVRKYQYPDSIRHIDHKKTARYQTLMTKTYDSYQNHHLIIACDLGRSMGGKIGLSDKKDFYLSAAIHLAEQALHEKDQVSFFAFHQATPLTIHRSRSLGRFEQLHSTNRELAVKEVESNYDLINLNVNRISNQRSIVVILADLTRPSVHDALIASLPMLCRKHLTVVLGLVDERFAVDERILGLKSSNLTDAEYGELLYSYWIDDNFALFERRVGQLGGGVVTVPEKHWLDMTSKVYFLLRSSLRS